MQCCLSLLLNLVIMTGKIMHICVALGVEAGAMNFIKTTLNCTVAEDFLGANGFIHPNPD